MSKACNSSVDRSTWTIWSCFVSVTNKKLTFVLTPEMKSGSFYELFEPQRQNALTSMRDQRRFQSVDWGLGRAAVCNCVTPWTVLLPFCFAQLDQNCRNFTGTRFLR